MLQHKIFPNGHYLLNNTSSYRISCILRRLVSYEQHESPTVPQHSHVTPRLNLTKNIPSSCHILIAGGGIIGQSIAYHLSEMGAKDIVLVEKAK
jgi:NADPH-dependent 2,4-dienoyl-CoA reductase/sulfur reductase-like enzyme